MEIVETNYKWLAMSEYMELEPTERFSIRERSIFCGGALKVFDTIELAKEYEKYLKGNNNE